MDIPSILQSLLGTATTAARREVDRYSGWLVEMGRFAQTWPIVASSGLACGCGVQSPHGPVRCGAPAVGVCVVCQQGCCLPHGAMAPGVVVCGSCISAARVARGLSPEVPKQGAPAPEPPKKPQPTRAELLRVLRLKPEATDDEIRSQYRELAKRHHPDRAKNEADRQRREARMRDLNAAYAALTQTPQQKAA